MSIRMKLPYSFAFANDSLEILPHKGFHPNPDRFGSVLLKHWRIDLIS